jgi:hypothetical protein
VLPGPDQGSIEDGPQLVSTATRSGRRIRRELETVRVMIGLYCRDHHGGGDDPCPGCLALWEYVEQRVGSCPYGSDKPTCLRCTIHCYKPAMREQIRVVMRYAGPRMAWSHPILALLHTLDGRRDPAGPPRPAGPGAGAAGRGAP